MSREMKFSPRIVFKGGVSKTAPTCVRAPSRRNATPLQRVSGAGERKWTK